MLGFTRPQENVIAATTGTPSKNRLITALPGKDRQRLLAGCDRVDLDFAEVLVEEGDRCSHVYFPIGSFISLVAALDEDARLEVGIIGDEGMLGTSLILGVNVSPVHAVVQGEGAALRMSAANFRRELDRSPMLRQGLNRYVYVLLNQLAQTALCTRYHFVDARLARWLLLTRDRAHSNRFQLTHQFLAYMLGVRRVGVTKAAGSLEKQGLIGYHRGNITILDDTGLEEASCRCYRQGKHMYEQFLGVRGRASHVKSRARASLRGVQRLRAA